MKKVNTGIKKTNVFNIKRNDKSPRIQLLILLSFFCCLSQVYAQRNPINVNLIIDGSSALTSVKEEITVWVSKHLDQILAQGDAVTVWNAGAKAAVEYTGKINSNSDKEAVIRSINNFSAGGEITDFSGALIAVETQIKTAEQGRTQETGFSYTLLISASSSAITSLLSGSQANLLRFSRVEEFSGWRAVVVGLNLDNIVRRAAVNFINSQ